MDETTENAGPEPAGEEVTEESVQASEAACACEPGCSCERCCGGKCHGLCGGIFTGAIVGAALALLLKPLKGEKGSPMTPSGEEGERRERIEEEGPLRAQVAKERASSIAGALVSGALGVWRSLRERLSAAWVEGKEGMAEGQEEARRKHAFMTRRNRHRR
jgi:gas vesicle protein